MTNCRHRVGTNTVFALRQRVGGFRFLGARIIITGSEDLKTKERAMSSRAAFCYQNVTVQSLAGALMRVKSK